jgi:hypothetical protein
VALSEHICFEVSRYWSIKVKIWLLIHALLPKSGAVSSEYHDKGSLHEFKCVVALVHEDRTSSMSNPICDVCVDHEDGSPLISRRSGYAIGCSPCEILNIFIQRASEEKRALVPKIILMTEVWFEGYDIEHRFEFIGLQKMHGLLRQIQDVEHLEWL